MFRGTTPKLIFEVNKEIKLSDMKEIWLTIKGLEQEVTLKLTDSELEVDDVENTITVVLTQEQTLSFKAKEIKLQFRFLDNSDNAYASAIKYITLDDIIKDGVIA